MKLYCNDILVKESDNMEEINDYYFQSLEEDNEQGIVRNYEFED